MKRCAGTLRLSLALLGATFAACNTTYTPDELVAEEQRQDADASEQEKRDLREGQEGGANRQLLDDLADEVEREGDL
jgi:hypothetical protein